MANKLYTAGRFLGATGIGGNNADIKSGDFVSKSGGFMVLATSSLPIEGIANHTIEFASDNQTVAKDRLSYVKADGYLTTETTISGGTVTQADEGKYFDLSDEVTVDGTTKRTTHGQVKLERFISATLGIFSIANKDEDQ